MRVDRRPGYATEDFITKSNLSPPLKDRKIEANLGEYSVPGQTVS